jgi:gamma-butyrobetaine dioxygenase
MPPGYQLLHCLENSAQGGHSIFADGISVAESLRNNNPEAFELLASVRIPYRFHDADYDLRQHKTVIVLDEDEEGAVSEVNFNPGIASIFQLGAELTRPYYTAYREFMSTVRDPQFLVQFKLEPGEMAVFDNRRVMHGRTGFDPQSGSRYLRGFYLDRGDVDSKIRVLQR